MSEKETKIGTMYPDRKVRKLIALAQQNERTLAAEMRIALDKHLGLLREEKAA